VGTIGWPLRLWDDAAEFGYTDDSLQTPLYEAYSTIFDIVTGHVAHPIMQLFRTHLTTERQTLLDANDNDNPTSSDLLRITSRFPFSVPVLPGDASLALDFMASLK
jgi:hypothetical protein